MPKQGAGWAPVRPHKTITKAAAGIGTLPAVLVPRVPTKNRYDAFTMDCEDDGPEGAESDASEIEEPTRGFRTTPVLPTKAEVEAHNDMGHVVYRSLCSACPGWIIDTSLIAPKAN